MNIDKKRLIATLQAVLPFIKSMLIAGMIAGLVAIYPILVGASPVNWVQVGLVFGLAVLFSCAHSIDKYLQPSQPDLAKILDAIIDALEKRYNPPLQGSQNAPTMTVRAPDRSVGPTTQPIRRNTPGANPANPQPPLQG